MPNIKCIMNLYYSPEERLRLFIDENDWIVPINGGSKLKELNDPWINKKVIFDDSLNPNISYLNGKLNEMTSLYFAYTHQDILGDAEYVGLCHYRRRFEYHAVENVMAYKPDIICAKPIAMAFRVDGKIKLGTVEDGYKICHIPECWDLLESKICSLEDRIFFDKWKNLNFLVAPCNMFIMKKSLFNKYCEYIFPILLDLVDKIDLSNVDGYQYRQLAFIAERITSYWIARYEELNPGKVYAIDYVYDSSLKPADAKDSRGNVVYER